MVDVTQEECERIKEELATLRQIILRVEPLVVLDGRFEKMITSPLSIIVIAGDLLDQLPAMREALQLKLDADIL